MPGGFRWGQGGKAKRGQEEGEVRWGHTASIYSHCLPFNGSHEQKCPGHVRKEVSRPDLANPALEGLAWGAFETRSPPPHGRQAATSLARDVLAAEPSHPSSLG